MKDGKRVLYEVRENDPLRCADVCRIREWRRSGWVGVVRQAQRKMRGELLICQHGVRRGLRFVRSIRATGNRKGRGG